MSIEIVGNRYIPTNNECLPGDLGPDTCQAYMLTLHRCNKITRCESGGFGFGSSGCCSFYVDGSGKNYDRINNENRLGDACGDAFQEPCIEYIIATPAVSPQVVECGRCPSLPVLHEFFDAHPSSSIFDAIANNTVKNTLIPILKENGSIFITTNQSSEEKPNTILLGGILYEIGFTDPISWWDLQLAWHNKENWAFLKTVGAQFPGKKSITYKDMYDWMTEFDHMFTTTVGGANIPNRFLVRMGGDTIYEYRPALSNRWNKYHPPECLPYGLSQLTTCDPAYTNLLLDWPGIYLTLKPVQTSTHNLLIVYDTINNTFVEEIVLSNPYDDPNYSTPDMIFCGYVPNTNAFMSQYDPEGYLELKQQVEKELFNNVKKACCWSGKNQYGIQVNRCTELPPTMCTVEGIQEHLQSTAVVTESPLEIIVATSLASSTCAEADCTNSYSGEIQGTCCIVENNTWTCQLLTQSACYAQKGFWEGPQENGAGGFNDASCEDRGVKTFTTVVEGNEVVLNSISLGPRNCAIHGEPLVDDTSGVITLATKGACCSFSRIENIGDVTVGAVLHTKLIQKLYYNTDTLSWVPIDIAFSASNDGTSVNLCFSYDSVINSLYPILNGDVEARNLKIENDFNIINNTVTGSWKLKFDRIENNCIFLYAQEV